MDKVYYKKQHRVVEMYGIDVDHGVAMVFDSMQASKNGGNGWVKIPIKHLIPVEYVDESTGGYMSKSERNSIKQHIHMVEAKWECEDGMTYNNLEDAIAHQKELLAIGDLLNDDLPFCFGNPKPEGGELK